MLNVANLPRTDAADVSRSGTALESDRRRAGKRISLYVDFSRDLGSKTQMLLCHN